MLFKNLFQKKKCQKEIEPPAPSTPDERALTCILLKCDCKLERLVEYILAATQEEVVCEHCAHRAAESCTGLIDCAAAVAAYMRERDGHA